MLREIYGAEKGLGKMKRRGCFFNEEIRETRQNRKVLEPCGDLCGDRLVEK